MKSTDPGCLWCADGDALRNRKWESAASGRFNVIGRSVGWDSHCEG